MLSAGGRRISRFEAKKALAFRILYYKLGRHEVPPMLLLWFTGCLLLALPIVLALYLYLLYWYLRWNRNAYLPRPRE
jgi:hypothetical protein